LHEKRTEHEEVAIKLLGINITKWPKSIQFSLLSAGVFVFFVTYGYVQELVFRLPGMKPYGWYMTLVQFIIYALLSCSEMSLTTGIMRRIPFKIYLQIAFYTVATMGLSNASLGYLNYPTQVVFKCCKLIPVLIGGIIIQGKRYGIIDVFAAILMSVGLIIFSLADSKLSPVFNAKGYVLVLLALVADAIIGNVQEKAMKNFKASNEELVLYSYSIGSIYLLIGTVLSGEFFSAYLFFSKHPVETYGYILFLGIVGYFGVNVVLTLVRVVGALVAVTVTTMRKAITVVFSFYFFCKAFHFCIHLGWNYYSYCNLFECI